MLKVPPPLCRYKLCQENYIAPPIITLVKWGGGMRIRVAAEHCYLNARPSQEYNQVSLLYVSGIQPPGNPPTLWDWVLKSWFWGSARIARTGVRAMLGVLLAYVQRMMSRKHMDF